ncbi:MAG: hypothetical protein AB7U20_12705 [Planctomycetaceae bacterium]
MSERPPAKSGSSDSQLRRAAEPERPSAGHADDVRRLADVIAQLDAFAAEVSLELESIRTMFSEFPTSRKSDLRPVTARPEPVAAVPLRSRVSTGDPSIEYGNRSDSRPAAAVDGSIVPTLRSTGRPVPDKPPLMAEDGTNGHDRLTALKERLAAKLQADPSSHSGRFRPSELTAGPSTEEGSIR